MEQIAETEPSRLKSIDVLRGFDMFFLVGAGDMLRNFFGAFHSESLQPVMNQLEHSWLGFTAWDIIMPLFLFTSGLSMPFSFEKYLSKHTKNQLYIKILKRFLLLFLLGWIAQGNLLDFDVKTFHIYCNTLHAIAFGYLITSIIVLNINKLKIRIAVAALLVLVYWALLSFAPTPGYGSGNFTPEGNFAMYIDRLVLGRFIDGMYYTWALSSLGFGATMVAGYFSGYILKQSESCKHKLRLLFGIAITLIIIGLLWTLQMPMIKPIWSPSMILLSAGICYALLALSYLITDKWHYNGIWIKGLRVFGLNSIAAYMLYETFRLNCISEYLLHGFRQSAGDFFPLVVSTGSFIILYLILWFMYKHKIFLKV